MIAHQTIALDGSRTSRDYPVHLRRIRFHDTEKAKTLIFLTNQTALPALTICDLYKSRWQVELFLMDQTAPADQAVLWNVGERREDTNLDRGVGLCAGGDSAQTAHLEASLYTLLQIISVTVFEKIEILTAFSQSADGYDTAQDDNQLNLVGF